MPGDADRFLEHGVIKAHFVAEMVVDGGDVGAGAGADIANGGGLEAVFREDLAGRFKQAGAGNLLFGAGRRGVLRRHPETSD